MWARIHPDRNTWAASGPAGRLQEAVVLSPLWQELPGRSGHKLRLLGGGGCIHGVRSPGPLRTRSDGMGGHGATPTQQDADVLRTPGVDFGKYGDASMQTETPGLSEPVVRRKKDVGAKSTLTGVSGLLRTCPLASGYMGLCQCSQEPTAPSGPAVSFLGAMGPCPGLQEPSTS